MPKKAIELSAKAVRDLNTPGRHSVGGVDGLSLVISDNGTRSWALRVMINGKRRELGLGGFPDVTLASARDQARQMREQTRLGLDPTKERLRTISDNVEKTSLMKTFKEVAIECHKVQSAGFKNPKHAQQWINTLKAYAFPTLGDILVSKIEARHVLSVLSPIWATKTETASRVRGRIQQVLSYARAAGYRDGPNPAVWTDNLEQALRSPRKIARIKHHPALPVDELPRFMARLAQLDGVAARALEFTILAAARVSEVRFAKSHEFNLDKRLWIIPGERMKAKLAHTVPLSNRAVEILQETGKLKSGGLVFPGITEHGALSENTQNDVIKQLHEFDVAIGGPGFLDPVQQKIATAHGMRSTFKDWARTKTAFPDEASELALAHSSRDKTRAAYARDVLTEIRTKMMEAWSQYCSSMGSIN